MKTAFQLVASIYRMYLARNMDVPYLRTCMTIVGPLLIFSLSILGFVHFPSENRFSLVAGNSLLSKVILMGAYFLIMTAAFYFLFNKQKILKIQVSEDQIKTAKRGVPIMFVLMILLLSISLVIRAIGKGTINF